MAWFKYLALIGIIGVANADLICYITTVATCLQQHNLLANLCTNDYGAYNMSTCVQESAKTCKIDMNKDVIELVAKMEDVCKAGTKANNDYKHFWTCITGSNAQPPDCAADFSRYVYDLIKSGIRQDKLQKEVLKASCKFASGMNNCYAAKVGKACGADAENFILDLQTGPSERLNKQICDLINGVGRNSLNLSV